MNALVGIRGNSSGILSATSTERTAVEERLNSNLDAWANGLLKSAGVTLKSDTTDDITTTATTEAELDRDAFLQLLVTELQNQDPLEPVDNQDMLAQLAQFSSLEQMESLNTSFEELSGNIDQLNFISANALVGRTVTGLNDSGELVEGTVDSVTMSDSLVYLQVGDEYVSMAGVLTVE